MSAFIIVSAKREERHFLPTWILKFSSTCLNFVHQLTFSWHPVLWKHDDTFKISSPELQVFWLEPGINGTNWAQFFLVSDWRVQQKQNQKRKTKEIFILRKQKKIITYQFRAKLLLLGANLKGRGSVKKIIDLTFLCLAICRGCRGILQEKDSKNETVCIIMYS